MKVAIYCRVSTTKQDYENQLLQLEEYCKKEKHIIYKVYSETISGKESQRPVFKEMMQDALKKKFDGILVWALDRFTREGTAKVWHYINLLNSYGVKFISYSEPAFNTDNEMVRDILLTVMATLAKQERLRISERTKAGLEIARAKGIRLGRKEVPEKIKKAIVELHEQGKNYREICNEVYYWTATRGKKFVSLGFVHKTISDFNSKKPRNIPVQALGD